MSYREDAVHDLSELRDEEALAFAALTRAVLRADGGVSDQERQLLAHIATEVGEDRFWQLFDRVGEEISGKPAVEELVRKVARQSARELIFATLSELAITESIVPREAEVLDWLAGLWSLSPEPVRALDES